MGFAWSHTWWAEWRGILFNFEWKRDREYFIDHADGARVVYAQEAYNDPRYLDAVRVYCSSCLGGNEYRKQEVRNWYANR